MGIFSTIKKGSFYTVGEEISSSISHGVGALLSIAGTVLLLVFSAMRGDGWKVVSSAIYGFSMILLFTMSTLYHAITNERAKKVLRVFDHNSIFILIAGTYTPLTLVTLRKAGAWGWVIFGIVWAAAIVGVVLNSISVERFKRFSMACYIASGWCIVMAFVPFVQNIEKTALLWLIAGGLFYTVGIFFYRQKSKKHFHAIWHWFVVAGAVCHYFCILFYVILPV